MTKKTVFLALLLFSLILVPGAVFAQKNAGETRKNGVRASSDVVFGRAEAFSDGDGALVRWSTSFEKDILGFEVYRSAGGAWEKLGRNIVPGGRLSIEPDATYGRDYRFFDLKGGFDSVYLVRAISMSGRAVTSNLIYPRYENNFAALTGSTADELRFAAAAAAPVLERYSPYKDQGAAAESLIGGSPPDLATQLWVAAQPGVKIGVKTEGFYRVNRADLENAGFDVNSDEANWQLYLNGNQQSIIVGENGDYIEFYGKGIDTRATDTNVYFLVVGDAPGLRVPSVNRKSNGSNLAANFKEEYYRRDRSLYVTSISNGDKENFFGQVITSTPVNIQFDLDSVDFSSTKARIQVGVQGFTATAHKIAVSVNGNAVGSFQFNGKVFATADIGVPTSMLVEGTNTVQMAEVQGTNVFSLVESVYVRYSRSYTARADELQFPVPLNKEVLVTGFADPNIRVLDITAPDHPKLIANAAVEPQFKLGSSNAVRIPSNMPADMFAVSATAVKTPASLVANTPSSIHSETAAIAMFILTHSGWQAEADTWAAYRTGQGTNAEAVDITDVYDEFGFGRRGPEAIKGLIEYTQANWTAPPGYILLMGDATYDPRNYRGDGFFDYVPTEMIETAYEETGSDEALADFDQDGLSVVSIGRIPVRNGAQVTNALTKVTGFEQNIATAWPRGAMCASDITQIVDFAAECAEVINQLPAEIPKTYVNKGDIDARATLLAQMNLGKYITNYSGHGSTVSWTSGGFFGTGDVDGLTNQNALTVYTMLTCLNGYFTDTTAYGLSERLIHATGGAVATWSSSGKTTPDVQKVLALRFYDQLANNASMDKIGDLVKDAKTAVIAGRDVRLSWTLLGDPAMKMK